MKNTKIFVFTVFQTIFQFCLYTFPLPGSSSPGFQSGWQNGSTGRGHNWPDKLQTGFCHIRAAGSPRHAETPE